VLAASVATVAWADNTFQGYQIVRVMLNNQEVLSDVPAVNLSGSTMLPLRKMAELAGLSVDKWDPTTNTVHLSSKPDLAGEQVASVNGQPITKLDLYNRMAAASGARTVDALIQDLLIKQAAEKAGVVVTPAEVDRAVDRVRQHFASDQAFEQALAQNQLTLEQLRTQQSQQIQVTKLLQPEISVDDATVIRFFEANRNRFDTREVHARHILLSTEQEARQVKAQLDGGADFQTLAREKSVEPSAKTTGGDLGFFGVGKMDPAFEKVVFSLQAGQISQPFRSPFGWHVAQVVAVRGAAPEFAAIKGEVTQAYIDTEVGNRLPQWLSSRARPTSSTRSTIIEPPAWLSRADRVRRHRYGSCLGGAVNLKSLISREA
jgi:parvulin-like peptidyl-prolyl isomerase